MVNIRNVLSVMLFTTATFGAGICGCITGVDVILEEAEPEKTLEVLLTVDWLLFCEGIGIVILTSVRWGSRYRVQSVLVCAVPSTITYCLLIIPVILSFWFINTGGSRAYFMRFGMTENMSIPIYPRLIQSHERSRWQGKHVLEIACGRGGKIGTLQKLRAMHRRWPRFDSKIIWSILWSCTYVRN
ncbi:hypothetical protein ACFTRD_13130 [Paenibacillus sp. NPDC056933]|uniref:hypothetical protein n=1 Tax=Paenibacillus sp. NPDC056933 TaxID=3345968 RepID=UPI003631A8F7